MVLQMNITILPSLTSALVSNKPILIESEFKLKTKPL